MSDYSLRISKPKISVVMTSYNNANYLTEAIDSIINQILTPYELLICDDCSTDESWEIISGYRDRYPDTVKAHRHSQNRGIAHNLNSGIKRASGNLICWTAGDDCFHVRKLELEWKALRKNPKARIAYSNVVTINSEGKRTGIWFDANGPTPPSGDVFVKVFSKRFFPHNRSLFRSPLIYRSSLDEVGYLDENLKLYEDWDMKIRLTSKYQVAYSGEALVEYRVHGHGIHCQLAENVYDSAVAVLQKNMHLLESRSEHELREIKREIQSFLRHEFLYSQRAKNLGTNKSNGGKVAVTRFGEPEKKSNRNMNESGENLIFLISQPRSGSTVLQRILAGHPDIQTTAEPWIMLHPIYALKRVGITTEYDAGLAYDGLVDFLSAMPGGESVYLDAIREMASTLYGTMLASSNKRFFLDKTPRYFLIIPELYRLFPQAGFIFLLRNPLAVLSSILDTWIKDDWARLALHKVDLLAAPKLLVGGIDLLRDDAIVLRYEEMVSKPEKAIRSVCEKLGIEFVASMLRYGKKAAPVGRMGDQVGVQKHTEMVTDSIEKWVSKLATPQGKYLARTYLTFLGKDTVNRMGYCYEKLERDIDAINVPTSSLSEAIISQMLSPLGLYSRQSSQRRTIAKATVKPGTSLAESSKPVIQQSRSMSNKMSERDSSGKDEEYGYLVSAIVSTYKAERFIRGCLEDLVSQTLYEKGQLEIVVIDSNSPENEKAIVEEFQRKYDHIKYVRTKERETLFAAWNRGIKMAQGKYITNANTDDRHRSDQLERMSQILETDEDISLVYVDVLRTHGENETLENNTAFARFNWPDYDRRILLNGMCFMGPQPMWRKAVHDEYGYFDSSFVASGDYEFWTRISQTRKFYYYRAIMGLYLESETSIEHANAELRDEEDRRIVEKYTAAAERDEIIEQTEEFARLLADAHSHLENGQIDSAINSYSQVLKINATYEDAIFGLAICARHKGDNETALKYLSRLLDLNPDHAWAYNQAGLISAAAGDLEGAKTLFAVAIQKDPGFVDAQRNFGEVLLALEDYDAGVQTFAKILENHPDDNPTLLRMAQLYAEAGNREQAAIHADKVLENDPENEIARELLLQD